MIDNTFPDTSRAKDNADVDYTLTKKIPHLRDSMHPRYLEKSALAKAWEAQKQQKFSKDNPLQSYTTEPGFCYVMLFLFKSGLFFVTACVACFVHFRPPNSYGTNSIKSSTLIGAPCASPT
jgi:hypothetical protein